MFMVDFIPSCALVIRSTCIFVLSHDLTGNADIGNSIVSDYWVIISGAHIIWKDV